MRSPRLEVMYANVYLRQMERDLLKLTNWSSPKHLTNSQLYTGTLFPLLQHDITQYTRLQMAR